MSCPRDVPIRLNSREVNDDDCGGGCCGGLNGVGGGGGGDEPDNGMMMMAGFNWHAHSSVDRNSFIN